MAYYIDASEFFGVLEQEVRRAEDCGDYSRANSMIAAMMCMGRQPAADVAPVIHACWEEQQDVNGDPYYRCSACGCDFITVDGGTPMENSMRYCPECGAKMYERAE